MCFKSAQIFFRNSLETPLTEKHITDHNPLIRRHISDTIYFHVFPKIHFWSNQTTTVQSRDFKCLHEGTLVFNKSRPLLSIFKKFFSQKKDFFCKNFGKDFSKDFDKDFGKDFGKDFDKNFSKDFGKDFGKDFSKAFGKVFGTGFGKCFGMVFGKAFGQEFGEGCGNEVGQDCSEECGNDLVRNVERIHI